MPPPILPALDYASESVARAAELLRDGQLVIVPTETVYGIALNLQSPQARARVKALKNLVDPQWVVHLPSPEAAEQLLPDLPAFARRILHRAWPGPIAFQIPLAPAEVASLTTHFGAAAAELLTPDPSPLTPSSITLRCPDHPTALAILAAAGVPVAIIAAGNPTDAHPPYEVSDIPDAIQQGVDALVDAGPTRYRKPSTLTRIGRGVDAPIGRPSGVQNSEFRIQNSLLTVLRPGVIDERIILRMADFLILFVCSGNTCRSPMAATIAQHVLAQKLGVPQSELPNRHVVVQSAGLHAARGMRATPEAVDVLREHGLDLGTHFSQSATLDLLRRADVIYTMTDAHREEILDALPGAAAKVHRLDPDADIDDPIGHGEDIYRYVASRLEQLIRQRMDGLVL